MANIVGRIERLERKTAPVGRVTPRIVLTDDTRLARIAEIIANGAGIDDTWEPVPPLESAMKRALANFT